MASISDTAVQRYTAQDPDVRLMLRVRDGDAMAFEELMLRYQGRVASLMTHLVGRRDLAEDLTQDVFLRVYRARRSYVPGSKFATWLFTIAHNVAANSRRSSARRREINLAPAAGSDTEANSLEAHALDAASYGADVTIPAHAPRVPRGAPEPLRFPS